MASLGGALSIAYLGEGFMGDGGWTSGSQGPASPRSLPLPEAAHTDMWGIQREWPSETVLAGVMGWRQLPDRLGQTAQSVCASGGEQQARLEGQVH